MVRLGEIFSNLNADADILFLNERRTEHEYLIFLIFFFFLFVFTDMCFSVFQRKLRHQLFKFLSRMCLCGARDD